MARVALVVSTYPNPQVAAEHAHRFVVEGLAACAQSEQVVSTYLWQGRLENQTETRTTFKTRLELVEKLASAIAQTHPYQTPEILSQFVDANNVYGAWVAAATQSP